MKIFTTKLCWILFFLVGFCFAQNIKTELSDIGKRIELKYSRILPSEDLDMDFYSGNYELCGQFKLDKKSAIIVNLPFSSYSISENDLIFESKTFGNIFVGYKRNIYELGIKKLNLTMGAFLPTNGDRTNIFSLINDIYSIEKYFVKSLSLYTNLGYYVKYTNGFNFSLELGPTFVFPTKGNGSDPEIFLHGGANLAYVGENFFISTEFVTSGLLTEDNIYYADRFNSMWNIAVGYSKNTFTAKIFYGYYLSKSFREIFDGIVGFTFSKSL